MYTCAAKDSPVLKTLLEYDPYLDKSLTQEQLSKLKGDAEANIIFARQDYWLKDGISLGLDREKYYLVLSAVDEFLERADAKLKRLIPGVERADADTEQKVVSEIEQERSASESGLGAIFG